jgi:hypothetical protein
MLQQQNALGTEGQRFVSNYLVPTTMRQAQVSTSLHQESSEYRFELERFITQKFADTHSAVIRSFMPRLIALSNGDETTATIGIRSASENALFLEQYMEWPIEEAISSTCLTAVNRKDIVEIGNFAAKNVSAGGLLFTLLALSLRKSGFKWMTFTATTEIEKLIGRLGCEPVILSDALPEKLAGDPADWGAYYLRAPKVMICNLEHTIVNAVKSRRLETIFNRHKAETISLARAIRSTNNQRAQ